MAGIFVLLEAFNRKEAAALGFFPCATAACFMLVGALPQSPQNTSFVFWNDG